MAKTTTEARDLCEIFTTAQERLNTSERWGKGSYKDRDGRCCLLGACDYPHLSFGTRDRVTNALGDAIITIDPSSTERVTIMGVADWNDRPGRSYDDVMKVLNHARDAACKARATDSNDNDNGGAI